MVDQSPHIPAWATVYFRQHCATVAVVIALSEVLAATWILLKGSGERRMNIMGIGPQEIMVISVLALLVFGPGKLPEVMGQAGKLVRDFRRMSAEFSGEFEKTIAEARDLTSGLTAELGGMTKEVNSVTNSVKKDLGLATGGGAVKAKSSTAKAGGTTSSTSKPTTSSSTKPAASAAKSTTSSSTTSTSTTTTPVKKAGPPVASREDPAADFSLFEPVARERKARARRAVPSLIADPTPRTIESEPQPEAESSPATTPDVTAADAVARARQRRRSAGYARQSA